MAKGKTTKRDSKTPLPPAPPRRTSMDTVHSLQGRHERLSAAAASTGPGQAAAAPPAPVTPPPVAVGDAAPPDAASTGPRADGWENIMTGLGVTGFDKRKNTEFKTSPILTPADLRDIYRGNGIGKRIVELPTREMMRPGFDIKGDEERKVQGIFEERGIHKQVANMIRWSRLFGGAIGVMGLQDGLLLDQPLNEKAIKKVEFLHVFDRDHVSWSGTDLYNDPRNPKYGRPKWYHVSPATTGRPFTVHESRVVILDGLPVDDTARIENQGWGDSALQSAFESLRAIGASMAGTEIVIDDFITAVLKIKNLGDLTAAGNWKYLKERLNYLDMSKHLLNTMLIDGTFEEYEKKASSVAGLPDLLDRFALALSADTGIPQTLLMGRSPAGLNATGDSDIRNWYDQIAQDQRDLLNPIYERLIRLTFLSKEYGGKEPKDWEIVWRPLWQPTKKEQAETDKLESETLTNYADLGAISGEEVREIIREKYKLTGDLPEPADEEANAELEAAAAEKKAAQAKPPKGKGKPT